MSDFIDQIVSNYHEQKNTYIQELEEEEEAQQKKKKLWKFITGIIKKFALILSLKVLAIVLILTAIMLPLFMFIAFFSDSETSNTSSEYSSEDFWDNTFKSLFDNNFLDIPFGIPVEKWMISCGFDYKTYTSKLNSIFVKITYGWIQEYYYKHQWLDFARTYQDKKNWYYPLIFATNRGIIKEMEIRDQNYNYTKYIYSENWYLPLYYTISKKSEQKLKPYWFHVITSSLDGKFYVMYAHMSETNLNLLNNDLIDRWDILGRLGNTGNSTGPHLHYEIRYCGENNKTFYKWWRDCSPINPLAFLNNETSYIWFGKLPKVNYFSAGNIEVKNKVDDSTKTYNQIKESMTQDCKYFSLFLFGKNNISCEDFYPIYYNFKNEELFPKIQDKNELIKIGKDYVNNEYQTSSLSAEKISEIAKLEWVTAANENDLYLAIGWKFSYWKFQNKQKTYKIDPLLDENQKKDLENKMIIDLIEQIYSLKRSSLNIDEVYNKYFINNYYQVWQNPYVYNFLDKNHLFMDIKNSSGEVIGKYNKEWVLVIFNKIK